MRVSCEDGALFIKTVIQQAWDEPFPDLGPVKSANQRAREARRRHSTVPSQEKGTRRISHFAMNLPDSAISFLGAFRGLFAELRKQPNFEDVYVEMPMVHCYCFTRELELNKAKEDIRQVRLTVILHWLELEITHYAVAGLHFTRSSTFRERGNTSRSPCGA